MVFVSRDLSFLDGNAVSKYDSLFRHSAVKTLARMSREREWSREELRAYVQDHSGPRHYGFPDDHSFDEFVATMCNDFKFELGHEGLPDEFFAVPGVLQDFAYFVIKTSPRPQKVLALLGGICLVSCLIGRKIKSSLGATGNVFIATFAQSASGKNRVLEAFSRVTSAAGCPEYILPGDMTSDSALADALSKQPAGLWPIDEFGKFMEIANSDKASGPLKLLISLMMKMFSACGIRDYRPKKFADGKNDRVIDMPHLVIYATGTDDSLRYLTPESNRDGFNSRFIFYNETSARPAHRTVEDVPIPSGLLDWIKLAANYRPGGGDVTWETGEMRVVPVSPEAQLAWERFRRRCDILADTYTEDEGASIYARTAERASNFALIFAASQVFIDGDIRIEKTHMDWAIALVDWLTVETLKCIEKVGRNARERDVNEIVEFVRSKKRVGATLTDITKHFRRMTLRYRVELLEELVGTEVLVSVKTPTTRKVRTTLYIPGFAPKEASEVEMVPVGASPAAGD